MHFTCYLPTLGQLPKIGCKANMKASGRILSLSFGSLKTQKQCMFQLINSRLLPFSEKNRTFALYETHQNITGFKNEEKLQVHLSQLPIVIVRYFNLLHLQYFVMSEHSASTDENLILKISPNSLKNRVPFLVPKVFFRNKT